jgi:hypothetical protein
MTEPGQLDFEQIKNIISSFSDGTLEKLAEGPLPTSLTKEGCRACDVLEKLTHNAGAERLREWHDFVEKGYALLGAVCEGDYGDKLEEPLVDEVTTMMGMLSYSRCLIIYFAAIAELESRRRAYVEDGLDITGEPPDERDGRERREDEIAEDADRRLDAEKVGDL